MTRVYLFLIAVLVLSACSGQTSKVEKAEVKPAVEKKVVAIKEKVKPKEEKVVKAENKGAELETKNNKETEKLTKEKSQADAKLASEKQNATDKAAKEQAAKEQLERKAAEKAASEKAQVEALELQAAAAVAEKQATEKAAAEKAAKEQQAAKEKAEQEAAEEQAARETLEREAAEKAAQEQAAKEKAAQERAARERAAREEAAARAKERAARQQAAGAGFQIPNFKGLELGGAVLTPMGAERSGNKEGTIPEWKGTMRSAPGGVQFRSGDVYPDPYKNDKVLHTVRASNVEQYKHYLSEGLQTLLKKYPDTFYMNIYPSHRDGRYDDLIEQRTKWNSTNTKLVNGVDGLSNYTGGAPFPMPKNANEVLWNGRVIHPTPTVNGVFDDVAVYLNGNKQVRRQEFISDFPFASKENPVGMQNEEIGINAAYVHVTVEKPDRLKGQMTIIHEALDQVKDERMAWVYIPASRRVRRAPTVGYDTPDGPGGLVTVDDSLGFNGAMDRYDWKLLGKKEMYIPYHSYKFDTPNVDYDVLLQKGHANPEFMRYELHRVWVVEANLKSGARHVYIKRRFYIDEDSWHIVLVESFDGRGDLWRVGILNTVYDFAVQGFVARAQIFHDMQSGGYIAMRLVNNTAPARLMDAPKGESYYSPNNLRKLGK